MVRRNTSTRTASQPHQGDKRFIRRSRTGKFTEKQSDVSRSLSGVDQMSHATGPTTMAIITTGDSEETPWRTTSIIRLGALLAILLSFVLIWTEVPYAHPADDLYLAAGTANITEVRKLLKQGVDPNAAVDTSGITALMQAARIGDTAIGKLLLNRGANVNAKDHMGMTALMDAAAFGNVDMVKLLIDNGADIHTKDTAGLTALSQAKVAKKEDIVNLLKTRGAKDKSEEQSSFNIPTVDKQIFDSNPRGK